MNDAGMEKDVRRRLGVSLGASLSYFTVFSLAPLLIIIIAVAGFIFGSDAAEGRIYYEIESLVGKVSALLIQIAINHSSARERLLVADILPGGGDRVRPCRKTRRPDRADGDAVKVVIQTVEHGREPVTHDNGAPWMGG